MPEQTTRRLHQLLQFPLRVGSDHISPAFAVGMNKLIHQQRCIDEVSRRENGIGLLLGTASTADYPSVSVEICSSVVGVVSRSLAAGLRQFDTRRRFTTSPVTAAVSDERRRSAHLFLVEVPAH